MSGPRGLALWPSNQKPSWRSFTAGSEAYKRYPELVKPLNLLFVRASGLANRVVQSALYWTAGKEILSNGRASINSRFRIFCLQWIPPLGPITSEDLRQFVSPFTGNRKLSTSITRATRITHWMTTCVQMLVIMVMVNRQSGSPPRSPPLPIV